MDPSPRSDNGGARTADSSPDGSQVRKSAAEILAGRLRRLRTARGLTQRKMALALGLGAHSNIADFESGRRLPQNDILGAYERYFSLPSAELQRLRARVLTARARAGRHEGPPAGQPFQPELAPLARDDPRQLGGFHLVGRLGSSMSGQSYLALTNYASPVVVKVADPELAAAEGFRSRLSGRLNTMLAVTSPHVARVLCADTDAERPWVAHEYFRGPSIVEITGASGPLPSPVVRALAQGLAEAVTCLHQAGATQLKLNPANIRLGSQGPVIIDPGIWYAGSGTRYPGDEAADGASPPGSTADVLAIGAVLAYAATGIFLPNASDEDQRSAEIDLITERCQDDVLANLITSCLDDDPRRRPRPAQMIESLSRHAHVDKTVPPSAATGSTRVTKPRSFRALASSAPALTGLAVLIAVLAGVAVTTLHGHQPPAHHPAAPASTAVSATARSYDQYGCVGPYDVPPTVRLDPGNPRDAGWRSSTPMPWDTPYCTSQIWWAPYLNNGANPAARFSWIFLTHIPHPATCAVWAYYPPPPSGHSGRTARYSVYEGSMYHGTSPAHLLTRITVDEFRYRGTWHPLGTYQVSQGLIKITLDNTGTDPDPEHGPVAGPIHVSCS